MKQTELRVPGYMKRGRLKKSWDKVVKEDIKMRGFCRKGSDAGHSWKEKRSYGG